MSFQTTVNYQPGAAVPGDFASNNPRYAVIAGPGQIVTATGGVAVATFVWLDAATNGIAQNTQVGSTAPAGFIAREQQALVTTYLAEFGGNIPAGFGLTVYNAGDFWVYSTTAASIGQKIFASITTGAIQTGTAGATITGYVETNFFVASISAAAGLIKMSSRAV